MTRILVTGAAGFIGRHLVPHFRAGSAEVVAVTRESGDIEDEATWRAFPEAEVVVHLAGKSFVPASWHSPADCVRSNMLGTLAALEYCRRTGARLVFMSSYLYGRPDALPIPESAPLRATNPYALSKQLAEETCRFFAERFRLDITVLRPFNVYGPDQRASFLIPSVVRAVEAGRAIEVKDLEPKRDYVHVDDVVRAIAAATSGPRGHTTFNIGSGTSHSVADVIALIQAIWRTSLPVHADGERRPEEIMDTVADVRAAAVGLGWSPEITLEQGLARICAGRGAVA